MPIPYISDSLNVEIPQSYTVPTKEEQHELLKFAIESGMIDLQYICAIKDMNEKRKYLELHPYSIWQGKDGLFYTYLPDEQKGRTLRKRNTRTAIEKLVVDYWKEQQVNPTLKEVFDEWNDRRLELEQISPNTHQRNEQIFTRHFAKNEKKKIKSVTPEWIEDFLERQIHEFNLTAKAYSNLKTVLRGFMKRAKKRKLTDVSIEMVLGDMDISSKQFKKVIKEDYEEVFSEEETDKMMEYLHNNMDLKNLGILLMFITGLRVGELVALKYEDFDGQAIKIRRTETRKRDGKNTYLYEVKDFPKTEAGVRTAIIPPDYIWIIKRLKMQNPFSEYVFMENGKRVTTNAMRSRLKTICRKLDIYHKPPHKIRKTYGSILIDSKVDTRMIIDQMGHTNILCTEQFYHRNRKTVDKKSEILGAIPEFKAR